MAESDRLTVHGIELETVRRGAGRPILLLHGFQTIDPDARFLELLSRHGEIIAPSGPGFGQSPRPKEFDTVYDLVHFYLEVLGFRPYWHGGMKDNQTDWLSLQVPDRSDWLEYMLNQPAHPDLRLSGVMNHVSLGVADMKQAQAALESHGWKAQGEEHAQMGRDGKWQLNLYDPDRTRIELMEFKPAQKPCCSDFTAPHPSE